MQERICRKRRLKRCGERLSERPRCVKLAVQRLKEEPPKKAFGTLLNRSMKKQEGCVLHVQKRSESILQKEKKCFITGRTDNLHCHHIYFGSNRRVSDLCGFWVWLTGEWHNQSSHGVHFNHGLDIYLKQECQRVFEEKHSRKEFMHLIGRNYL